MIATFNPKDTKNGKGAPAQIGEMNLGFAPFSAGGGACKLMALRDFRNIFGPVPIGRV